MIKILTPDEERRIKSKAASPIVLSNAFSSALYEGGWRHGVELVEHKVDPDQQVAILRIRSGERIIRVTVRYES